MPEPHLAPLDVEDQVFLENRAPHPVPKEKCGLSALLFILAVLIPLRFEGFEVSQCYIGTFETFSFSFLFVQLKERMILKLAPPSR